MKIDFIATPINLSLELARVCNPYAAIVYAALLAYSKDGYIVIGNRKLAELTNVPERSIPKVIRQLVEFGIITRTQERGCTNQYQVKDVFETIQPKRNDTAEVPAEQAEPARQSAQPLPKVPVAPKYKFPYYVMLSNIGSPLANDFPLSESDVDALTDERETEECTIPSDWAFSDNQKMIEDALKYLAYFSRMKEGQLKEVKEDVIISLSEAICTGKKGTVHGTDPYLIINRLNTIIHSPEINLSQWLDNFTRMFSEKFDCETQKIYNYHSYLKTAAINYLSEYKAQIYNGFYEDE